MKTETQIPSPRATSRARSRVDYGVSPSAAADLDFQSYEQFIEAKSQSPGNHGFKPTFIPDFLFPFQKSLLEWSVMKGRSSIMADCGLGKTPMQLAWAQNIVEKTNKPVLILTPLAVGFQTVREGEKFGIECAQSRDGKIASKIVITNYQQLSKFDWKDFGGVACDESSILKNFDGAIKQEVTEFMKKLQYRSLYTATAAPNDYIELGTSSEALGELGYMDMLGRFFKNAQNSLHPSVYRHRGMDFRKLNESAKWCFRGHAEQDFWRWVCSWARAVRKPSDLGFSDDGYVLPKLETVEHIVKAKSTNEEYLFDLPAVGLKEQRAERRRTMQERCEMAAELISHHKISIAWCHLNSEGDLLESIIPNALQISGNDDDDYKETVIQWFCGHKCICGDHRFSSKLATWQKDQKDIGNTIIERIVKNEMRSPQNTQESTKVDENLIPRNTISPTSTSGSQKPRNNEIDITKPDARNIEEALQYEKKQGGALKNGRSKIQKSASLKTFVSSESLQTNIEPSCTDKAADVLSADQKNQKTKLSDPRLESEDSTLIIATKQGKSEVCSAQIVILDSESLAMIPTASKKPQCICGHQSGVRRLISKGQIVGYGLNFQFCNHQTFFPSHSFEQYYQCVRRSWRFGQKRKVTIDVIASEGEQGVLSNLNRKAAAAEAMFQKLVALMKYELKIERNKTNDVGMIKPSWL